MKEEKKRYFLVEYVGVKKAEYNTYQELKDALTKIRKYNRRKNSKYLVGNIKYHKEGNKFVLTAHMYNKLTDRNKITDLDNYTSQFDEFGLMEDVYDKLITGNEDNNIVKKSFYPDINIAYFESKNYDMEYRSRVRYIPVLYKEDIKYLDWRLIQEHFKYRASIGDLSFFVKMANAFNSNHACSEVIELLRIEIERVKYYRASYGMPINPKDEMSMILYYACSLYNNYVAERNKDGSLAVDDNNHYYVSRRRVRDFAFFVKNYDKPNVKIPTRYNYKGDEIELREMQIHRRYILERRKQAIEQLDNDEYVQLSFKL